MWLEIRNHCNCLNRLCVQYDIRMGDMVVRSDYCVGVRCNSYLFPSTNPKTNAINSDSVLLGIMWIYLWLYHFTTCIYLWRIEWLFILLLSGAMVRYHACWWELFFLPNMCTCFREDNGCTKNQNDWLL